MDGEGARLPGELDDRVRGLVRVVPNRFDEDMEQAWGKMHAPASLELPLRPCTFFDGSLMPNLDQPDPSTAAP